MVSIAISREKNRVGFMGMHFNMCLRGQGLLLIVLS